MATSLEPHRMPEGTVTFLFSDVEGSTRLLETHGRVVGQALLRHHELFEEIIERNHGAIFETVGDAVYACFSSPADAVAAAVDAHRALAAEPWTEIGGRLACRIAIHSGDVELRGRRYFGAPLFRCARLQALAYGEQTVISAATATLLDGDVPAGARLIDRGLHRLKDLQEPERVFELQYADGRIEFPALKSLNPHRHNLPVQLSSFIGRAEELATVGEAIGAHRLVTLLGPGGIGKTRLAMQAAADEIDRFAEGAWFVDLASIRSADQIAEAIAMVLGVRQEPDRPISQTLLDHLKERTLLLILDNLEQLLPAGAAVIGEVLAKAPALHVLATSRSPIRIRGEVELEVRPLSAGDPARTDAEVPAAVALFLARAREIRPDTVIDEHTGPLIAAICNRLDGLPLAIELAAARLRLLNLQTIHDRLGHRLPVLTGGARDLPERQQTLRAAIAWSDELLAPAEAALFHRLGAFVGSFGVEGARMVSRDESEDVESGLMNLLEHSLIRRLDASVEPRFSMLETIREFALDQLVLADEHDATLGRIAEFVTTLVDEAREQLIGPSQAQARERLDAELPNIKMVLEHMRERGESRRLAWLVAGLARFWTMRGLAREGAGWVAAAAEMIGDAPSDERAALYQAEGIVAGDSRPSQSIAALTAASEIYRASGNRRELARTLVGLSNAQLNAGKTDAAHESARLGQEIAREVGDLRAEAGALGNSAVVMLHRGRMEDAEAGIRQAVELFRRAGDMRAVVVGLGNLAEIAGMQGNLEEAIRQHRIALQAARENADPNLEAWELVNLAAVLGQNGEVREALPLANEGVLNLLEADDIRAVLDGLNIVGTLLHGIGDLVGATQAWTAASALADSLDLADSATAPDPVIVADARDGLGDTYDDVARAARELPLELAVQTVSARITSALSAADGA